MIMMMMMMMMIIIIIIPIHSPLPMLSTKAFHSRPKHRYHSFTQMWQLPLQEGWTWLDSASSYVGTFI